MREQFSFEHGRLLYGSNIPANYRLFREYRNTVQRSGGKAVFCWLAIPMYLDNEIGWLFGLWVWVKGY